MTSPAEIRKDVESIVRTYGKLKEPIPGDRDLYTDLGVESVNAISILLALETRFQAPIDDARFVEARTLDGLVGLIATTQAGDSRVA